jgi:hypothetical protein
VNNDRKTTAMTAQKSTEFVQFGPEPLGIPDIAPIIAPIIAPKRRDRGCLDANRAIPRKLDQNPKKPGNASLEAIVRCVPAPGNCAKPVRVTGSTLFAQFITQLLRESSPNLTFPAYRAKDWKTP